MWLKSYIRSIAAFSVKCMSLKNAICWFDLLEYSYFAKLWVSFLFYKKEKSNLHCTGGIMPKRVTSGGAHPQLPHAWAMRKRSGDEL